MTSWLTHSFIGHPRYAKMESRSATSPTLGGLKKLNSEVVDADSFAWISLEQSCGR